MSTAATASTALPRSAAVLPIRPHTFRLDNALIDTWGEQIGATAVGVYCALARYANRQTGECWPSITTLATKLKLGRNTVKKYLRVLVQHGLISWQPRWDEAGDQTSHRYTVHPCPAPCPVVSPLPAGGRSVADPPSVHLHGGGGSAAAPEQDPEQHIRTTAPMSLSALQKKTSSLSLLVQDHTTSPAYTKLLAKQHRCAHPLWARHEPYAGYQRCRKCDFDQFPLLTGEGPPTAGGSAPGKEPYATP